LSALENPTLIKPLHRKAVEQKMCSSPLRMARRQPGADRHKALRLMALQQPE
jgi:hypothetical protein